MSESSNNNSFIGKVAWVSGAAQGNGAAIARGLARVGARVILLDINAAGAGETAQAIGAGGMQAHGYGLDITDADACNTLAQRLLAEFGPASVLVNNAGILLRAAHDSPEAAHAWRQTIDVNLHGTFNLTQALLSQLKATRGAIINISSIHAFVAPGVSAAYSASKGAIAQFTKAMAVELANSGVRVNALAPGMIRTPMTEVTTSDPERSAAFLRHVPMGRCGEPEELVGPVLFLASDAASYVTGAVLPVDGGYLTL